MVHVYQFFGQAFYEKRLVSSFCGVGGVFGFFVAEVAVVSGSPDSECGGDLVTHFTAFYVLVVSSVVHGIPFVVFF